MSPCSASHLNTGNTGRRARSIADAEMPRQHARNIVGESATGDMGKTLDRAGLADRAQARSHVKPRRRQQRTAERHDRRERRLCIEANAGCLDDFADQGKSVGVNARRGQTEHRVAGCDIRPRQQRAAFGGADCKAREIVIAVLVETRHLGGFTADQGAAGFPAPLGYAGNDGCGGLRIEFAAGKIVQKEQRLRALHHEVVDRHRHQIDADAAMHAGFDGDLDLGADAIGCRDQNRVLEARGLQIEQAAETADFGFGSGRAVARTIGLIRSTSRLPASISTPESA